MFDDLLGKNKKQNEETKESIIEAMKYNIEKKNEIIKNLMKKITELERRVEKFENDTCVGI